MVSFEINVHEDNIRATRSRKNTAVNNETKMEFLLNDK